LMVTGNSQQSVDWIASNTDAWITYLRPLEIQAQVIERWHGVVDSVAPGTFKPFALPYKIDLVSDPDVPPTPIHNGHRLGRNWLIRHLEALEYAGANHVLLNLKFGSRPAEAVLDELAMHVVPRFPALGTRQTA
jgi:hypothetical protein